MVKAKEILNMTDHTLLKQDATEAQIDRLIDEASQYHCASVCIPPSYVAHAKAYLNRMKADNANAYIPAICTVIGFPNGYQVSEVKAIEASVAISDGADELDMVINVGLVKDKKWDAVASDIRAVRTSTRGHILKVIIETCLLTKDEIVKVCQIAKECDADFVKTSTGFSTGGATKEDVKLMRETVGNEMGVKASGGIRTLSDAQDMIEAGASRIGASAMVKAYRAENQDNL